MKKQIKANERTKKAKAKKMAQFEADDIGNAFMTQYPQAAAREGEKQTSAEPPKRRLSKQQARTQSQIRNCLTYLGIRDKRIVQHVDPSYQTALEGQVQNLILQDYQSRPSYTEQGLLP